MDLLRSLASREAVRVAAKVSRATQAVLDARALYVKRLRETVQTFGNPPYMTARVDPRTADRQISMMTPDDMVALMQQDPQRAQEVAKRAEELRVRAAENPPPFSAPGEFEPK